jgi:hypothetical protein
VEGAIQTVMIPLALLWAAGLAGLVLAIVGGLLLRRGDGAVAAVAPWVPLTATWVAGSWLGAGLLPAGADSADRAVAEGLVWFTGWLVVWPSALASTVAAGVRGARVGTLRGALPAAIVGALLLACGVAQATAVPNLPPAVARSLGLVPLLLGFAWAAREGTSRAVAASALACAVAAGEASGRGLTAALMFGESLTRLDPAVRPAAVGAFADAFRPELPWAWAAVAIASLAAGFAARRLPVAALAALSGPLLLVSATPDPAVLAEVAVAMPAR